MINSYHPKSFLVMWHSGVHLARGCHHFQSVWGPCRLLAVQGYVFGRFFQLSCCERWSPQVVQKGINSGTQGLCILLCLAAIPAGRYAPCCVAFGSLAFLHSLCTPGLPCSVAIASSPAVCCWVRLPRHPDSFADRRFVCFWHHFIERERDLGLWPLCQRVFVLGDA